MLNAAVIGVGSMGKNHARIYHSLGSVNLVAIADSNEGRAEEIAKKHNCNPYSDYKQMIENEKIDLVSVAVPTTLHGRVAIDCLNKKIHCLVEKPIACSLEEGKKMIVAAEKNNVKLMVGHIERFNPAVVELKKRLSNKELGEVFKMDVNRVGPFPAHIKDSGVVIDLATHDIDVMRYLTGSEVSRLYAETGQKIHASNEDILGGLLRFENGAICNLNINWLTPTKIRKLYLTGDKGMFVVNYLSQDLYFYENENVNNNLNYADIMRGVSEGRMTRFFVDKKEPLLAELEYFIECVKYDKEPSIGGEDGLKALHIALTMIDSAKKRKVISFC